MPGIVRLATMLSFGQFQSSFAGYATRPGGIDPRGLALAFAANTLTVVAAQLFVLRALGGRRRTTGVALAAAAWAASWATVIVAGHLGGGGAEIAFAAAMVIFALGEFLLSATLPAITNDLAPPGAAGRYNGLGALAFTTGFLAGPAGGAAALGALPMNHHLPPGANQIPPAATPAAAPAATQPPPRHQPAGTAR